MFSVPLICMMAEHTDYITLSKRFESFAERCADPMLADTYRRLAITYRALDFWHERFKQRYEIATNGVVDREADANDKG
jgi:hypothetical protein